MMDFTFLDFANIDKLGEEGEFIVFEIIILKRPFRLFIFAAEVFL